VVEIENASPAPFVAAFVVGGTRDVTIDAATVRVDGVPALISPRAPSRWAASRDATTFAAVADGGASSELFPGAHDGRRGLEVAFLHPVAHRTTLRAALLIAGAPATAVDLRELPDVDAVVRAWSAQLDRGMRVELPDPSLAAAVRAARAELLVWPGAGTPVTAAVVAALEDWGFDVEAAAAWHSLGLRARRRASGRVPGPAPDVDLAAAPVTDDAPALLLALRRALVDDRDGDAVAICADYPRAWLGQDLEVHDAPTRRGPVSFAVRWHGPRPALLWDVPAGTTLSAPGLDPSWSTSLPRGDALLAPREVTA